jgi:protease-4
LVEIEGPILQSRPIVDALEALTKDKTVRAILLRIDSPGGAVAPSQEIHRAVLSARAVKPVVVTMGSLAASGGYYIASAGTHLIANPGTLTGSIGVIMGFVDFSDLLNWAKLRMEVVKTGPFKDTGSGYRPLGDDERAYLQALADEILNQFVADVVKGRAPAGVSEADVRPVADGRVFSGAQARELRLVDELGGYADAVSAAAKLGGIEGTPHVYQPRLRPPWLRRLLEDGLEEQVVAAVRPLNPLWAVWLPGVR